MRTRLSRKVPAFSSVSEVLEFVDVLRVVSVSMDRRLSQNVGSETYFQKLQGIRGCSTLDLY